MLYSDMCTRIGHRLLQITCVWPQNRALKNPCPGCNRAKAAARLQAGQGQCTVQIVASALEPCVISVSLLCGSQISSSCVLSSSRALVYQLSSSRAPAYQPWTSRGAGSRTPPRVHWSQRRCPEPRARRTRRNLSSTPPRTSASSAARAGARSACPGRTRACPSESARRSVGRASWTRETALRRRAMSARVRTIHVSMDRSFLVSLDTTRRRRPLAASVL